jgi:hypothetical protein
MASAVVEIEGLREFQRNLQKINRGAAGAVRKGLRTAAEPARRNVETHAVKSIRNIGPQWSRMRIGAPAGSIYIAPKSRNRGGSPRPNLSRLLLNEAMIPGVGEKRKEFLRQVGKEFDRLANSAGF